MLFGDSSVATLDDTKNLLGLSGFDPREVGFTNWTLTEGGTLSFSDELPFDYFDYVLRGSPMWRYPSLDGHPPQRKPLWRMTP